MRSKTPQASTQQPKDIITPERIALSSRIENPYRGIPEAGWISDGARLQVTPGARRQLLIRLGIDFGTAFTKVAIRAAGRVFFVDWQGIQQGPSPHFLSGELSETPSRSLELGSRDGADRVIKNLKLPFLGVDDPATDLQVACAATFLGHVLRYSRAWLYKHQSSLLAGNRLIWEVNLGAPTETWAKNKAIAEKYQRLGIAAWKLSQLGPIKLDSARQILSETESAESGDGLDALAVLPEFAAQIAGYVHSPQRRDGLYLLTDVGAGTVDIACFRIMRHDGANCGASIWMRVRDDQDGRSVTVAY